MKLENQVISLELAKRLHELGVTQRFTFTWFEIVDEDSGAGRTFFELHREDPKIGSVYNTFGAPTVAELGVMLPATIDDGGTAFFRIEKGWVVVPENQWSVSYQRGGPVRAFQWLDSLAEAMGKLLIHLLEDKLITVEEVNARLEAAWKR